MHYLARSDIRACSSPLEKAVLLHQRYELSYREIEGLLPVSKSQVGRAIKAAAAGRVVGKHGRPSLLCENEELYLVELISTWKKHHQEDMAKWELERDPLKNSG